MKQRICIVNMVLFVIFYRIMSVLIDCNMTIFGYSLYLSNIAILSCILTLQVAIDGNVALICKSNSNSLHSAE